MLTPDMLPEIRRTASVTAALLLLIAGARRAQTAGPSVNWTALPPLPGGGVAAACAGVSNGALIVAGGSDFPAAPPWDGGAKRWHDAIRVLEHPNASWQTPDRRLPFGVASGASVTHRDSVICLGGANRDGHLRDVIGLRWTGSAIELDSLPPLPRASAYLAAAVLEDTVYVAGGLERPEATEALRTFWALDLARPGESQAWEELEPWPGSERHLAVSGVQDGAFYLFGGIRLRAAGGGGVARVEPYLQDGYRFTPGAGGGDWVRTRDLPRAAAAAPSPALAPGQSHLVITGGLDGSRIDVNPARHPGFVREVLVYHTITDTWLRQPDGSPTPSAIVAPVVAWGGGWVIVGGEIRPAVRTPSMALGALETGEVAFGVANWSVVVAYLAALLLMSLYFSRREQTTHDFFLAGRRIPWWAAGLSIFGTQLSALTFMAAPAVAYSSDWIRMSGGWTLILVAGLVVVFFLPFFRRLEVSTAYEYLERRFSLAVRLFASTMFVLFQLGRIGIVLFLPAIALAAVTGLDVVACIVVMGFICTAYTVVGGMEAVIWTDVMQVVVLLASAVWCLGVILADAGGPAGLLAVAVPQDKLRMFDWRWDPTAMVAWVMLVGSMFTSLVPYTTDQSVIQRYMTTRDEAAAARSVWTNTIISIPAGLLFFALGTALYVFYQSHPELLRAGRHDEILPRFMVQQLPAGLAGLGIAGIFAASMSSLDSSMNSVAASLVNDVYRRLRPAVTDAACLRLAKGITVAMGAIGVGTAILLASRADMRFAADYFNGLMGLLGGGLAGVFLLAVFTPRSASWRAFWSAT
ncbi:MAG: sodium/solute symporter [Vicinamibacterales bacterium]|jgi:SSS family transporter|nr:sodium/solute symporter [Vicinamibacterales bacterium]MDP6609885.1 sodium/solute symporter [Vicinamibacterales bacterium]HAK56756.1 sodium:solute symporter [Acidobacteriota bacterium]